MIDKEKLVEVQKLFKCLDKTYEDFWDAKYLVLLDKKNKIDGNYVADKLIEFIESNPNSTSSDILKKMLDYYKPWEDEELINKPGQRKN